MIKTLAIIVKPVDKGTCSCRVVIKGKHRDIMNEYHSTVESISRAILKDVPESLQSTAKQEMELALYKVCMDVL